MLRKTSLSLKKSLKASKGQKGQSRSMKAIKGQKIQNRPILSIIIAVYDIEKYQKHSAGSTRPEVVKKNWNYNFYLGCRFQSKYVKYISSKFEFVSEGNICNKLKNMFPTYFCSIYFLKFQFQFFLLSLKRVCTY